jgi:hypothetical protein
MSEETYSNEEIMNEDYQQIDTEIPDRFSALGFDEGDWEMFVLKVKTYDPDKLVKLYLNISRNPQYSPGWRTEAAAFRSKDFNKMHAIARDTMESYSPELIVTDSTDSTDSNTMSDDYVNKYVNTINYKTPAAAGVKRRKTRRRNSRKSRRRKTKKRKSKRRTRRSRR